MKSKRIVIGLPMYGDVTPENKIDCMRFAFCLGRHYADYDFMLAFRSRAEQFRARNFIVDKAREADAEFLFFLDDDQIFDWMDMPGNKPYMFLRTLLNHMVLDKKLGIVGALYYQRGGGMYKPVLMHDTGKAGVFYDDHQIEGKLQEVDIQGGGAMLIRMEMFDKIPPPYFKPETLEGVDRQGTDLQICRLAKKYGWKVACDTSIIIGHVHDKKMVVSPRNRHLLIEDAHRKGIEAVMEELTNWQSMVMSDVLDYTGLTKAEVFKRGSGQDYEHKHRDRFRNYTNPSEYYISIGEAQILRQAVYHSDIHLAARDASTVNMFRSPKVLIGLDYGCGIGSLGFEAARMKHHMDFVDIEGTAAFAFLKWRLKKHKLMENVGFAVGGHYDFVIMNNIIEHLQDWEYHLDNICGRMKQGAALITNFFVDGLREDDPEHFHLDRQGVREFLIKRGFLPSHMGLWIKTDNFMGGPKNASNIGKNDDLGNRETCAEA